MKNFGEKGAWAFPGTAQFFEYPLLSQEWVKYELQILYAHSWDRRLEQKPIKNFDTSSRGRTQELLKTLENFQGTHRAIIFAVAQLCCL